MKPLQWHLKKPLACASLPEVLEKTISLSKSFHPHLDWWLVKDVLRSQPLYPLRLALQLFTDASNEGWGSHLRDCTTNGLWSQPENKLHINFLELKAVLLALKEFEPLCWGQTILVAMDNTIVVSYIKKEGEGRSGSPLETALMQSGQMEWSLLQMMFDHLCLRWHIPPVDLFAIKFNNKLSKFVSPVPDQMAWNVNALGLQWEGLDVYSFPPVSLLVQVVSKVVDQNMP